MTNNLLIARIRRSEERTTTVRTLVSTGRTIGKISEVTNCDVVDIAHSITMPISKAVHIFIFTAEAKTIDSCRENILL